jgi:putative ABC transport system permease protein
VPEVNLLFKLALSNLLVRKARAALTVAAIALAVSLVIAVTSGYATVEATAMRILGQFFGNTDAKVVRREDAYTGVPQSLVADLRRDPAVLTAVGRVEMYSTMLDHTGTPVEMRSAFITGIDRPTDTRVESMEIVEGDWFDTPDGDVAVIDQVTASLLKDRYNVYGEDKRGRAKVGETIELPSPAGNLKLRIVGIVHKPKMLAILQPSVYVPIRTLQGWMAASASLPSTQPSTRSATATTAPAPALDRVSDIILDLQPEADPAAFAREWRPRLEQVDPLLQLKLTSEQRGELDQNLVGMRIASYVGGAISLLAATFIILSTLSMGVNERQRTLAMLRAVGAHKRQLGGLVVVEAVLLAAAGATVGVPLGVVWVNIMYWTFADMLQAGIALSLGGIAFAVGGSMLAALAAAVLPALGATRTDPLEAMAPLAAPASLRRPMLMAIPGLLLVLVDPLILFVNWKPLAAALGASDVDVITRSAQFYAHFALGLPGIMIGFFLLAPLLVVLVERVVGPILAPMLGVRFALLRQQLSGGVWRAAGTAAALMVGLAILVVLQVQGHTVVGGWRIPDKFPDMFLTTFKIGGLTPAEQEKIAGVEYIKPGEILPIAIASPQFGGTIFSIRGAATMPDATLFFGTDIELALRMMQLDFRDGTPEQAVTMMTQNRRHILVTEEFRKLKGLRVGDKLALKTPKHGEVDYTIAGVVWSPGLDVVASLFDLNKQFEQRTAASVFGTLEDIREDFGVEGVYLFAVNLQGDVQKELLAERVQRAVGSWGVQAADVRQIKYYIQHHFEQILLMISSVAFSAMAVAALGVANTVMAGVRVRRWQFGVMRSIGVTRGQLMRMVMAEAVLLGLVGTALGLSAGGTMALNAKRLLLVMVGYDPPFTIPWGMIAAGAGVVMGVSILAGLWPAISVARAQPLALLQAGRAAA